MTPDLIPYLVLAFAFGLAAAYLFLRGRIRSLALELTSEQTKTAGLERENTRIPSLEKERDQFQIEIQKLGNDCATLNERANLIPELRKTIEARERTLQAAEYTNKDLNVEIKRLQTELKNEQENAGEKLRLLREDREELVNKFAKLSKDALTENRGSFLDLVTPFQTKLREFEQKVDQVYRTEAAERNSLKGEIGKLVEMTQQISKEASNLAQALKADTKKQGNWGELILEKVLEFSGLRKDQEYKLQVSLKTENGSRVQPDAIVYLPEKKHIVIDAKVSLVAYDRYCTADLEEGRNAALAEHIASVKKHIKELSDKDYSALSELDSPDFTLLFMPIESSFGLAIQADNDLFEFAWNRKIVIVSPSTLLATLRTIASIWKQERQTRNALDIADRAGKMYDKFVGFIDDMIAVGKKMEDAKTGYSSAMNKLSTGPGNLVRQSEQLKEMGAKATKQLSVPLLDRATETMLLEPLAAGPDGQLLES